MIQLPHALTGLATGALPELRDDWERAVAACSLFSMQAIELTAGDQRMASLQTLAASGAGIESLLAPFQYRAIHGRVDVGPGGWCEAVNELHRLPEMVDCFVVHAESLTEEAFRLLHPLASRLGVENADTTKSHGQTPGEMLKILDRLPGSRMVLDLAHAHSADPGGGLTREFIELLGDRFAHLHCSVLRGPSEHWPPSAVDVDWLLRDLLLCPPVPRIWEQVPFVLGEGPGAR